MNANLILKTNAAHAICALGHFAVKRRAAPTIAIIAAGVLSSIVSHSMGITSKIYSIVTAIISTTVVLIADFSAHHHQIPPAVKEPEPEDEVGGVFGPEDKFDVDSDVSTEQSEGEPDVDSDKDEFISSQPGSPAIQLRRSQSEPDLEYASKSAKRKRAGSVGDLKTRDELLVDLKQYKTQCIEDLRLGRSHLVKAGLKKIEELVGGDSLVKKEAVAAKLYVFSERVLLGKDGLLDTDKLQTVFNEFLEAITEENTDKYQVEIASYLAAMAKANITAYDNIVKDNLNRLDKSHQNYVLLHCLWALIHTRSTMENKEIQSKMGEFEINEFRIRTVFFAFRCAIENEQFTTSAPYLMQNANEKRAKLYSDIGGMTAWSLNCNEKRLSLTGK